MRAQANTRLSTPTLSEICASVGAWERKVRSREHTLSLLFYRWRFFSVVVRVAYLIWTVTKLKLLENHFKFLRLSPKFFKKYSSNENIIHFYTLKSMKIQSKFVTVCFDTDFEPDFPYPQPHKSLTFWRGGENRLIEMWSLSLQICDFRECAKIPSNSHWWQKSIIFKCSDLLPRHGIKGGLYGAGYATIKDRDRGGGGGDDDGDDGRINLWCAELKLFEFSRKTHLLRRKGVSWLPVFYRWRW